MFGIRLSFLRCQAGLTQSELGARLNLTASALGMYESFSIRKDCLRKRRRTSIID